MQQQALDKIAKDFTAARTMVELRGDKLWSDITDVFLIDEPFTITEAITRLKPLWPYSESTMRQFIRATLKAVILEERDDEPTPIKRIGNFWVLTLR